jgi:hypothetical protein
MSQLSPLARVKEQFGGKDKLVDKIVGLLGVGAEESKDDLRKRLLGAANKKLIRLHQVAAAVKDHGGHDKLVTATAAGLGRSKDKDYVEKLGTFSNGRLLDVLAAADKRTKGKSDAVAAAPKKAKAVKEAKAAKAAKAAESAGAKGGAKARAKSKAGAEKNA